MVNKKKYTPRDINQQQYFEGAKIKYVVKAKRWCKTYFENGKQVQKWTESCPQSDLTGNTPV